MLENEATKKTIFFEDFMGATLQLWMVRPVCLLANESVPKGRHQISWLRVERYARGNCNLSGSCKQWVNSLVCAVQPLCDPTSTAQQVPVVARPQEHKHDLSHRLLRHVATCDSSSSLPSHSKALFATVLSRSESVAYAEFPKNMTDMVLDRLLRQVQLGGNFFIA